MVTMLSADELQDIYDIRVTLEEMATRLAVPLLTEATLAELTSLVEQMDEHKGHVATQVKLNHEFHLTLYAASGRSHLCELNRMLRHRTQHYLHLFTVEVESENFSQTQGEHQAILEACRRGDAEKAAAIMRHHVAQVGDALVRYVGHRDEGEGSED